MLVITRRVDESIVICDEIVVTVLKVDRGQVKLGIRAPIEMPVDRGEVAEAKRKSLESRSLHD